NADIKTFGCHNGTPGIDQRKHRQLLHVVIAEEQEIVAVERCRGGIGESAAHRRNVNFSKVGAYLRDMRLHGEFIHTEKVIVAIQEHQVSDGIHKLFFHLQVAHKLTAFVRFHEVNACKI